MEDELKPGDAELAELQFDNYYVKSVEASFDSVEEDDRGEVTLEPTFTHNHSYNEKSSQAEVLLACKITPDNEASNFYLFVELVGFFSLEFSSKTSGENVDRLLTENASAILFPYLRSIISTITQSANVSSLILPTINVARMFREGFNDET